MRAVVQRVSQARVLVEGRVTGEIGCGLVVLVGVARTDGPQDASYLAEKISTLRVFNDAAGKMNLALAEVGGKVLAISQFTLYGDCRKGRRPSFDEAAPAELGRTLYETFVQELSGRGVAVETGIFQARMQVELVNDGPVTLLLSSDRLF